MIQSIRELIGNELIDEIMPDDDELKSHWAQYLCVLTSGAIEQEVKEVFLGYAQNIWQPDAAFEYLKETTKRQFQNTGTRKIKELVKVINESWTNDIEALISKHGESINSIVNNRNKIAHGVNTDLTLDNLREYFNGTVEFLEGLKQICR